VREKPLAITRNRDLAFLMSKDHLTMLLEKYIFTVDYERDENGYYSAHLKEIDIVDGGKTIDVMLDNLAKGLMNYANDYFEFDFYRAKNRQSHLPYVLHVLVQKDKEAVKKLLMYA
jgi:predicted RNase H-like HicB family nuclease